MPRRRSKLPIPRTEGLHVPLTLWRCYCGRRYRGDAALYPHLDRSGHGIAIAVRRSW